jgi:hypothetical protein
MSLKALGWRGPELNLRPGLDFLGLASPIERILNLLTPGLTNATERARYLTLVPWIYWRYTRLQGTGGVRDQRLYANGFEAILAYAALVREAKTGRVVRGVIRRRLAIRYLGESRATLPIRGSSVKPHPSPMDAALYGPSLVRLRLLGRRGKLHVVRPWGAALAKAVDPVLRDLPQARAKRFPETIRRTELRKWAALGTLDRIPPGECRLIRALLFSLKPFEDSEGAERAKSLALTLAIAQGATEPFGHVELETALIMQQGLDRKPFRPAACLSNTATHWRIVLLLKTFRHASEYAFGALYEHVSRSPVTYQTLRQAAEDLIDTMGTESSDGRSDPEPHRYGTFRELLAKSAADTEPPDDGGQWDRPGTVLWWSIRTLAWAYGQISRPGEPSLLEERVTSLGSMAGSSLRDYHAALNALTDAPPRAAARWLLFDRGISRHNTVAARKLYMHDTFRLVEDELGVQVRSGCPLSPVQVRTEAMLSLLSDIKLLRRTDEGYLPTRLGQQFLSRFLARSEMV